MHDRLNGQPGAGQPGPDDVPEDLIEATAAAQLAKACVATLYRWMETGRIRWWKRCGRRFVSKSEVLGLFKPGRAKNGRVPPAKVEAGRREIERRTSEVLRRFKLE